MAPVGRLGVVAVSACLAGEHVRWDGSQAGAGWPRRAAEALFALRGLCPEVGIGMGVPRPPIQLEGRAEHPRAALARREDVLARGDIDYAPSLRRFAAAQRPALRRVHGYIFEARSPSCGLANVKVFATDGAFHRRGRGVYAAAVLKADPTLPAVEAPQLASPPAFVEFALAVAARAGRSVAAAALERRIAALLAVDAPAETV